LLQYLFTHGARPEFVTRFHWTPGAIAIWDNRQTWHFAVNDYQGERRVMHRILLAGQKPEPAQLAGAASPTSPEPADAAYLRRPSGPERSARHSRPCDSSTRIEFP